MFQNLSQVVFTSRLFEAMSYDIFVRALGDEQEGDKKYEKVAKGLMSKGIIIPREDCHLKCRNNHQEGSKAYKAANSLHFSLVKASMLILLLEKIGIPEIAEELRAMVNKCNTGVEVNSAINQIYTEYAMATEALNVITAMRHLSLTANEFQYQISLSYELVGEYRRFYENTKIARLNYQSAKEAAIAHEIYSKNYGKLLQHELYASYVASGEYGLVAVLYEITNSMLTVEFKRRLLSLSGVEGINLNTIRNDALNKEYWPIIVKTILKLISEDPNIFTKPSFKNNIQDFYKLTREERRKIELMGTYSPYILINSLRESLINSGKW